MSKLDEAIRGVSDVPGGAVRDRLLSEVKYARRVSDALGGKHADLLLSAAERIKRAAERDGALTGASALEIEEFLLPMAEDCKKYRLLLCGHAHIDMNWMWRYDETVQITLDTFKTVLSLMDEFPGFTFSQSQASVYQIAEEYAPDLIERIAERAREGRWEVAATTWVEADRNMPSAESIARHHLYTARYLPKLLGIPKSAIPPLDYEPDTFGHGRNTPELLAQAGVKYYYHCRGYDGHVAYRWRAPSGAEVISYREPYWYLGAIDAGIAEFVPEFCETTGVDTALRVYGVGDHGGGPTRRDIERVIDMRSWPIFPRVEFGTYADFYARLERARGRLPIVDRELNGIFLGCYTSQSRVKKGSRYAERMLCESEAMSALAHKAAGARYSREKFEQGWRNVLFNQFHDILPGSCVQDSREHASGLYQQAYAVANSAKWAALNALADQIDTSYLNLECKPGETAQGGGAGFEAETKLDIAPVGRGVGDRRAFHVFNSCAFDRREVADITIWDYKHERVIVTDGRGNPVRHQVLQTGRDAYWGHDYIKILIEASVPAMGYSTYVIAPDREYAEPFSMPRDPRVERTEDWAIENECLRLECHPVTASGEMVLIDKRDSRAYRIDGFSLVRENPRRGMTAWVVGEQMDKLSLSKGFIIKRTVEGELYNELCFSMKFGERSALEYTVGLAAGSERLIIDTRCDFLELTGERGLPQLRFDITDPHMGGECLYDVPGGLLPRPAAAADMPGIRFIAGDNLALISDSKYGYRSVNNTMGVTLIRATTDPDPYPELRSHRFRLCVSTRRGKGASALINSAQAFLSPLTMVSGTAHGGKLPPELSMLRVASGSIELNAVKLAEDGGALVVRGVELCGGKDIARLEFNNEVKSARFADTHENPIPGEAAVSGNAVEFNARPFGMFTLLIELA